MTILRALFDAAVSLRDELGALMVARGLVGHQEARQMFHGGDLDASAEAVHAEVGRISRATG